MISRAIRPRSDLCRCTCAFSTTVLVSSHENPLGLPRSGAPPTMPRMQRGLPTKRTIPGCKKVVVVSSGKGGVGKSSIAVNLALALSKLSPRPRVGILDLDIFGPSIPKLMGLEGVGEPRLTAQNRLIPLRSHGIPCMSMGFLLPNAPSAPPLPVSSSASASTSSTSATDDVPPNNADTPVVWRGMMVMKAVQQLLFDVDWRAGGNELVGPELDIVVIDMPPGTGDVALSLGQLVRVDGAVIVSTPQDVAIIDTRKGIAMFKKIGIPIMGSILNMSHLFLPSPSPSIAATRIEIFGPPTGFNRMNSDLGLEILGTLPLDESVSRRGDRGWPVVLSDGQTTGEAEEGVEVRVMMDKIARSVYDKLQSPSASSPAS